MILYLQYVPQDCFFCTLYENPLVLFYWIEAGYSDVNERAMNCVRFIQLNRLG